MFVRFALFRSCFVYGAARGRFQWMKCLFSALRKELSTNRSLLYMVFHQSCQFIWKGPTLSLSLTHTRAYTHAYSYSANLSMQKHPKTTADDNIHLLWRPLNVGRWRAHTHFQREKVNQTNFRAFWPLVSLKSSSIWKCIQNFNYSRVERSFWFKWNSGKMAGASINILLIRHTSESTTSQRCKEEKIRRN